jgi:hypothetical protein
LIAINESEKVNELWAKSKKKGVGGRVLGGVKGKRERERLVH